MEEQVQEQEQQQRNGPVVYFEKWHDLIYALQNTYTISFKDVCKIFRASRSWTNQYIKPYIPSVFLNSNNRGDTKSRNINWLQFAARALGRPEMTESVWFHAEDFEAHVRAAIVSCTKQTKRVPVTALIPPHKVEEFVAKRNALRAKMREAKTSRDYIVLAGEYDVLPYEYIRKDDHTNKLMDNMQRITARTQAPAVPVPIPDDYMKNWQAPHDLKDYGDADEQVYRELFRRGAIRLELQFQDVDGKIGKKIFYVNDPDPIPDPHNEGSFIFSEVAWQEYQKHRV